MAWRGNEWPPYADLTYFRRQSPREVAVSDVVYLLVGVGVFALFAGYAALLRRA